VGFGFGDMVIAELLQEQGCWPDLPRRVDDVVFPFEEAQRPAAIRLAGRLRAEDRRVELALGGSRLKRAFADADRIGAARFWMLGPDELARGVARRRDLATGEESEQKLPD